MAVVLLEGEEMAKLAGYSDLMDHLRQAFASDGQFTSPPRQHYDLSSSPSSPSLSPVLLVMPAWSQLYIGVKLATVFPSNSTVGLPSISATYLLSCAQTGRPLANLDGTTLTLLRTACVSALAAVYLAQYEPHVLLIVGTGALAPHLARAHLCAHASLHRVLVWGRTLARAESLAEQLSGGAGGQVGAILVEACGPDLEAAVREADVIVCATASETPLVLGSWLKPGVHLSLVGSFRPSMRECDDAAIAAANGGVFVDSESAFQEAGELVHALHSRAIPPNSATQTLAKLCRGELSGRRSPQEITVFKSVGCAMVDLAAAQLIYDKHCNLSLL